MKKQQLIIIVLLCIAAATSCKKKSSDAAPSLIGKWSVTQSTLDKNNNRVLDNADTSVIWTPASLSVSYTFKSDYTVQVKQYLHDTDPSSIFYGITIDTTYVYSWSISADNKNITFLSAPTPSLTLDKFTSSEIIFHNYLDNDTPKTWTKMIKQ